MCIDTDVENDAEEGNFYEPVLYIEESEPTLRDILRQNWKYYLDSPLEVWKSEIWKN